MKATQPASGVKGHARRNRLGAVVLIGAACVLAVALSHNAGATLRGAGSSRQSPYSPVAHRHTRRTFRIGGSVGGLYPGSSALLTLTVTNPFHFAIVVTSITTAVGSPIPGCTQSNLSVGAFTGGLRVDPVGSAQVTVPVTLSHAAPDACQGVVFPLEYSGLARKA
jgi:hypothetical protein